MFGGEQRRWLVSVIPDLVEGYQLVREGVGLLLTLLEVERVVEVGPGGEGAVVGKAVQMRRHGVDWRERRVGRRDGRLDAVVLAVVLEQGALLLLQLLVVVVLALLVVALVGHVRGGVRAHLRPVRVVGERRRSGRGGCQGPVEAAQAQGRDRRPLVSPLGVLVHVFT